ncbi:MAG: RNA-directed DNA polymerase [Ramlibacter sp.]
MAVVNRKYDRLSPRLSYLKDEAVLAQAWKKAHTYVRRHNWYADTLELDHSGVCLGDLLAEWSASISSERYRTNAARLVPAPKNGAWGFSDEVGGGWSPLARDKDEDPVLRPLAHLGIREQTVATAVMLCLGDCIETAQGDPATPPLIATSKGVFSYGNRLFCRWSDDGSTATFPWGNSDVYSRYFQDYQRFVERPLKVAQAIKVDSSVVYIVKLDISAFFDNVDLDRLISVLRSEYSAFQKKNEKYQRSTEQFWDLARRAIEFRWNFKDRPLATLLRSKRLPSGLPQGLVASGFFSNAYLLEFDRAMGAAVDELNEAENLVFTLHDYCRYVDDLRLVVSIKNRDSSIEEAEIEGSLGNWVQRKLKRSTRVTGRNEGHLTINPNKTEVERFSAIGKESSTAARMKSLQRQLSGPFDLNTLQQTEAGLSGLLSLAELSLKQHALSENPGASHELAAVAKTTIEVRDDSLTRFSAYRLARSLRLRRSMTDLTEGSEYGTSKKALLHDFEAAARRLIAAWAVNPSLVQVLRYAFDLFPSPDLLRPVAQALIAKLDSDSTPTYERHVAYYVLAEIFKAGATETGLKSFSDTNFQPGDLMGYREALGDIAQTALQLPDLPWYAQQQALLFLAVAGHSIEAVPDVPELGLHALLHEYVGKRSAKRPEVATEIVISLVGYQLDGDDDHYEIWFRSFARNRPKWAVRHALKLIGEVAPHLFGLLLTSPKKVPQVDVEDVPKHLAAYALARAEEGASPLKSGEWIPYITVISHLASPFFQENALIRLSLALIEVIEKDKQRVEHLTPSNLVLRSNDWTRMNDPRHSDLQIEIRGGSGAADPIYATPSWCATGDAWMYAIGRLLRSAATGEPDFTAKHWLLTSTIGWYGGIRSTWQKRRVGLLHTANALRGSDCALTPWFSELLLQLLRWPGMASRSSGLVAKFSSLTGMREVLANRIAIQSRIYGKSADLPVYRYPVNWPLEDREFLRVGVVQGLMPQHDDFTSEFKGFEVDGYRERHRAHTASLLHLARRQLASRDLVLENPTIKPLLDIVVFPELSVHVEDQDLMRAFSDSTGAMLFYGVLGASAPATGDLINIGRWLIPQREAGRRSWIEVDQGKWNLTTEEVELGVKPWRPYQVIVELKSSAGETEYRISGSICYDATDLSLAADLRDQSHMYVIAAMNRDIKTFDSMVSALRYHMYQHVVVANIGEYGGSTAQAPYDQEHRRLISHSHGGQQLSVSIFDVRIDDFGPKLEAANLTTVKMKKVKTRIGKTPPAGLSR